MTKRLAGNQSSSVVGPLKDLARMLFEQGKFVEEEETCREVLTVLRNQPASDPEEVADALARIFHSAI